MRATYLNVAGRIRRDLQDLDQVVTRTLRIWEQAALSDWKNADNYYSDRPLWNCASGHWLETQLHTSIGSNPW